MGDRRNVVAGLVAAVATLGAVTACSAPPSALGGSTAQVTINGESTGGPHPVVCSQHGWAWTVETPDEEHGFSAAFRTEGPPSAQSVQITDLGGFTGSFWEDTVGNGRAGVANGRFRITGTARGAFTDNPTDAVEAIFEIDAHC